MRIKRNKIMIILSTKKKTETKATSTRKRTEIITKTT